MWLIMEMANLDCFSCVVFCDPYSQTELFVFTDLSGLTLQHTGKHILIMISAAYIVRVTVRLLQDY